MKREKCKWFLIETELMFDDFIKAIKSITYDHAMGYGFEIYTISKKSAEFKFIERREYTETAVDPFGNELKSSIIKFSNFQIYFEKISSRKTILKVKNAPASLKSLVNVISYDARQKISISKIEIDIKKIYSFIKSSKKFERISVTKASAKNILLNENTFASMEISSNKNSFSELASFLSRNDYVLDKVCMDVRHKGDSGFAEISNSGLVVCSASVEDVVDEYIFNEINNILKG